MSDQSNGCGADVPAGFNLVNASSKKNPVAKAVDKLEEVQLQTVVAQSRLNRLKKEVAKAESAPALEEAERLRLVNEKLLHAALHAQGQTEQCHETLKEVSHSVVHDSLTSLPNRALFLDRLEQAISLAHRNQEKLAVLFIDLNRFKQINDTLGHAAGDEVLCQVAKCLQSSVRESDTVSRYGGDEFLVLLTDIAQASDAVAIADKAIAAMALPYMLGEHELKVTASIGISVYPHDGTDVDTLIVHADAAMYLAKRHSLGSHLFDGSTPTSGQRLTPLSAAAFMSPASTAEGVKSKDAEKG